ncbi:serine/arginine repetitive matrix protein 1-like [Columba livia]|uniref:serine/arginine repetitive matrix protein 1-like n=1 Tax=Columba livia TaxID=8932 RepID=UPI0031BA555A
MVLWQKCPETHRQRLAKGDGEPGSGAVSPDGEPSAQQPSAERTPGPLSSRPGLASPQRRLRPAPLRLTPCPPPPARRHRLLPRRRGPLAAAPGSAGRPGGTGFCVSRRLQPAAERSVTPFRVTASPKARVELYGSLVIASFSSGCKEKEKQNKTGRVAALQQLCVHLLAEPWALGADVHCWCQTDPLSSCSENISNTGLQ